MALGGGTFTLQNKELPGSYINFVSAANASPTLSERGYVTMPLILDWGPAGEVFEVTQEDFQRNSLRIFGHPYTDDSMKGLRDLFANAQTLYAYRLNSDGKAATCPIGDAKYPGTRGNDLRLILTQDVDDATMVNVKTYLGDTLVDEQVVAATADLVDNDYVHFRPSTMDDVLVNHTFQATYYFTGGTNEAEAATERSSGTTEAETVAAETPAADTAETTAGATGAQYQAYLDAIESYSFNTMGVVTDDETIKRLFAAFVKRMRDEMGVKFQLVLYNYAADYYGVINVATAATDESEPAGLVYWVTGAEAACAINASLQNSLYGGEYTPKIDLTQSQLKAALRGGQFVLHKVGNDIRVLSDINSLVTTTLETGDIFKDNQTIRVIDQIGNDIATTFNTNYLGIAPNTESGRAALQSDIVDHHLQLQTAGAIEDFDADDVTVAQGEDKKSVVVTDAITVVNAMDKLYMTVTVA